MHYIALLQEFQLTVQTKLSDAHLTLLMPSAILYPIAVVLAHSLMLLKFVGHMYAGLTTPAGVQSRGRWLSADSARRYSKPADWLRHLKKLPSSVLSEAAVFRRVPSEIAVLLDPPAVQKKKEKGSRLFWRLHEMLFAL